MFVAGVDGGGTSTKIELRTAENVFLRREKLAAFNISSIGEESFVTRLHEIFSVCGDMRECAAICFGGAGISVGTAESIIRRELAAAGFNGTVILRGDHEIALRGAISGAGGVLIAGTGSICCGTDGAGRTVRVGGWGHIIDDGGSGYAIGRDALALTVRAEDGRAPQGALSAEILRAVGARDAQGVIEYTYCGASKADIAALAEKVLHLAADGDGQSLAILRREAGELKALAAALAAGLSIERPRIALMGGLLAEDNVYKSMVCDAILPVAAPVRPLHDALWGAAQLAAEALHPEGCK